MEITEIVLLIAGGIIFILSFLIPDKKGEASEESRELVRDEIADMVSREMESVRGQVDGVVEEAVTYAMEKTERSLERLSNEKIMAVNEYSDTVLEEIHKNHEEAMFLYDMLNSKHDNLKNTVSTVNRTVKEVEEKLSSFQEMTGISRVSQGRVVEERTEEHGVVQPVRLQEFHPLAASNEPMPVPAGPAAASGSAQPGQVMSVLQSPAAVSPNRTAAAPGGGQVTGQTAAIPVASVPQASVPQVSVPQVPIPAASVPQVSIPAASVPQASIPVASVPAASVPAASVPQMSMLQPVAPEDMSAAGRVSFLHEKAADGQNNNERILELYRQGKSKVAIAKELGLGVGEVKLVIDLFRNQ